MTKDEKIKLVADILDGVKEALLKKADQWPPDWDGIELRWLIEEHMQQEVLSRWKKDKARHRAFVMHMMTHNLSE